MARVSQLLNRFQALIARWFRALFLRPAVAQQQRLGPIQDGESVALLALTGSGKMLAAVLAALDRLMFSPAPAPAERRYILYVSPPTR